MKKLVMLLVCCALFVPVGCSTDPVVRHQTILSDIEAYSPIIGKSVYLYAVPAREYLAEVCALKDAMAAASDATATTEVYASLKEKLAKIWTAASVIDNNQAQNAVLLINAVCSKLASISSVTSYLAEDLKAVIEGICSGVTMAQALSMSGEGVIHG